MLLHYDASARIPKLYRYDTGKLYLHRTETYE